MSGGKDPGFAVALRELRLAAGLTQAELARRAGVSPGTVRDLEQGRRARPRAASVALLARALGLDEEQAARLAGTGGPRARPERDPRPPGAGAGLRVQVLGPVAAWRDGVALEVGPVRRRAVLALLALGRGSPVRRDFLIDALWPDGPPRSAVNIVHGQVSELRRVLGGDDPDGVLLRVGEGYQLHRGAELDVVAFEELCGQAETTSDPVRSGRLYERALTLWQGDLTQDVVAVGSLPAATALATRRAEAVLELARLACELGEPERAVRELRALAGREPLNERAHAWLMTALAGAGQQAAALEVFAGCRARLDEELGVRPGPELTRAHQQVLRQEELPPDSARSGGPQPSARAPAAPARVPRQLPAAVGGFTGRAEQLAGLADLVSRTGQAGQSNQPSEPGQPGGPAAIAAICGTAGAGKTALAVHWAHQVAGRFPGGQLYVNLRGYDPGQPVPAADALAGFLRALGMPGADIAPGTDERAAQYRSALAGRRMLVVLDNARSVDQVRPLLPGTPSCVVVVTSRDTLAGLVARDGARRLELDLLPPGEAASLLCELIGQRAQADPVATVRLTELCARLPLALRVAAEHVAARSPVPLADLVADLAGHPRRLDLLTAGDDTRAAVRAVFSWSCRYLAPDAARAFRLAGLHPGADFDVYALAALTGTGLRQAGNLARMLTGACLLQPAGPGRYVLHDLLKAYARELAASQDSDDDQRAALTRLFDHYLHTAAAAMDALLPAEHSARPGVPVPGTPGPPLTSADEGLAWLDAERAGLVAVAAHTAGHGWPDHATRLARILYRYLVGGGHITEITAINTHALRAARQAGDRIAEASALNDLGIADAAQCRYQQAAHHLDQALILFRAAGDRRGQARVLGNLGLVNQHLSRYRLAIEQLRQSLVLARQEGSVVEENRGLYRLGSLSLRQGRYGQAADFFRQALALSRETGNGVEAAFSLTQLGCLDLRQGRYERAAAHLGEAQELFSQLGHSRGEASVIVTLGLLDLRRDQHEQGASRLRRALGMIRETGSRADEAEALLHLGEAELLLGHVDRAARHLDQALALYREIGEQAGEAEALNGLGEVALAALRTEQAQGRHAAALALARQIGDPYEQARAMLSRS